MSFAESIEQSRAQWSKSSTMKSHIPVFKKICGMQMRIFHCEKIRLLHLHA